MKKSIFKIEIILLLSVVFVSFFGCDKKNNDITHKYLSAKESANILGNLESYYDEMGQKFLEFACQKKSANADEFKEYSMNQTLDFTDEEIKIIDDSLARIMSIFETEGYKLPGNTEILFAKTTMNEAMGAAGYTHNNTIFLGEKPLSDIIESKENEELKTTFDEIIAHEIFHCLTRNNPDFRKKMYSCIGFSIADDDFEIPQNVKNEIISNPDVRHHDSYATFTINGEKKDCYLVFLTDGSFEKEGDSFFKDMYTGLVDINDGTLYRFSDATDFYDVLGNNTEYCEDPEECMAINFSYAIVYGLDGPEGEGYPTPSIIENIIALLKE